MVKIKQMSYRDWLEKNPSVKEDYKCVQCNGTGICECPECGQDTDCIERDGRGHTAYFAYTKLCQKEKDLAESTGCVEVVMGAS